jgi:Transposase DDE domain
MMVSMKNDLLFLLKLLKQAPLQAWGKRRWQIEGWFKTAKHRFGLHRFGQQTLLGIYRWLILSLISYVLAHWAYLSTAGANGDLPDWGEAAEIAFQTIFPPKRSVTSFTTY